MSDVERALPISWSLARHVWRRNRLVWRKLAIESVLGNIADPLLYMLGFGIRLRRDGARGRRHAVHRVPRRRHGVLATMMRASFEAMYSGFSRMHVQRTWEAIINAPVRLDDVVFAEWVWAATKSFLSGTAVLIVAVALGLGAVVDHGAGPAARVPDRARVRRPGPRHDRAGEATTSSCTASRWCSRR